MKIEPRILICKIAQYPTNLEVVAEFDDKSSAMEYIRKQGLLRQPLYVLQAATKVSSSEDD